METRLAVLKCQLDQVQTARPLTLWPLLFAAPLPLGGLRAVGLTSAAPLATYASSPLANKPDARDVLVPVASDAGVVTLEPAFDAVARLTGWCVGAAALLLPGNRVGPRRGPTAPSPLVRHALEDFRRRLIVVLTTTLYEQTTAPTKGESDRRLIDSRAPEPPRVGSALDRLVNGPAHRLVGTIVTDNALRREDALATIRKIRRLATDPTLLLPAPDLSRPPRRLRRQSRRGDRDSVPAVIRASILSARLIWPSDDVQGFKLETPLIDGAGKAIGWLDGGYEVGGLVDTIRAMS